MPEWLAEMGPPGEADGELSVDLGREPSFYEVEARLEGIDLSQIPDGPDLRTDLCGEFRKDG